MARSTFRSQNVKNTRGSDHFWKLRCRKSARRWARSTFRSQNVQNTTCSRHFWRFGCGKSARPCGAKMYKTPHVRATFGGSDVEKVHAVVARSTFPSQNVKNTRGPDHFWRFGCRKSARRCGVKMYKTLGVRTTFGGSDVASLQDTTLHSSTLHYTLVHYITLHYTPVHSTTLNYSTPHYITLNDTATQIDR